MIFTNTPIEGAWILDLELRGDDRGFFARVWCQAEFRSRGLTAEFVQCNTSHSVSRGTVRGLHYQVAPHAEVKLIRCIRGRIFDVIVDVRPTSASYLQWFGVELSADNRRMFYVPAGCAHGYESLVDDTEVEYPVSAAYAAAAEKGIRWDDPLFRIAWPEPPVHVSVKDRAWPDFDASRRPSGDIVESTP